MDENKTNPAQLHAAREYKKRRNIKNIVISLPGDEADANRALMQEKSTTPIKVWRSAMQHLKEEPTDKG